MNEEKEMEERKETEDGDEGAVGMKVKECGRGRGNERIEETGRGRMGWRRRTGWRWGRTRDMSRRWTRSWRKRR